MDDTSIIELYWKRDEQAIAETEKKYGKLCYRIAENILKQKEDSEECVNDAFMKTWNSIPPDRPTYFSAYLCQIVKRLALSKLRYNSASKRQHDNVLSYEELSDIVSNKQTPEDTRIMAELSNAISNFLMREKKINRMMFIRRYWYYDSIEIISNEFKINSKTVGSILFRMRKRLKKYLKKEGFDL